MNMNTGKKEDVEICAQMNVRIKMYRERRSSFSENLKERESTDERR
jgi:hypothetical protein